MDLYIISATGEAILSCALKMLKTKGKIDELPDTATYQGKQYIFSPKANTVEKRGGLLLIGKICPMLFFNPAWFPCRPAMVVITTALFVIL